MKRSGVVKLFSSYLNDGDIAVFAGADICKEAYLYDREGNVYIEEESGIGISMALGLALGTDRRVFVFCEDYYFLKEIAASIHVSLSKRRNIYIILLVSGEYQYSGHNQTIFKNITSPNAMMFHAGFFVNNYTIHFEDVNRSKEIKQILTYAQGPLFATINISLGKDNKMDTVGITVEEQCNRLKKYLEK